MAYELQVNFIDTASKAPDMHVSLGSAACEGLEFKRTTRIVIEALLICCRYDVRHTYGDGIFCDGFSCVIYLNIPASTFALRFLSSCVKWGLFIEYQF